MRYDISKHKAPEMPNLGKGTECIKLLLSQASKDMYEPLVPMFVPVLGAHISGAEFQYPDLTWKEMCGQMARKGLQTKGARSLLPNNPALLRNTRALLCNTRALRKILKKWKTFAYPLFLRNFAASN